MRALLAFALARTESRYISLAATTASVSYNLVRKAIAISVIDQVWRRAVQHERDRISQAQTTLSLSLSSHLQTVREKGEHSEQVDARSFAIEKRNWFAGSRNPADEFALLQVPATRANWSANKFAEHLSRRACSPFFRRAFVLRTFHQRTRPNFLPLSIGQCAVRVSSSAILSRTLQQTAKRRHTN